MTVYKSFHFTKLLPVSTGHESSETQGKRNVAKFKTGVGNQCEGKIFHLWTLITLQVESF
jgi:hypothetical protein